MKKFWVILMISLLIFSGCSQKEEKKVEKTKEVKKDVSFENIKESSEIKVGLCAAYPPFESRNEKSGEIEGFDVDMARALAKELGVKATIIDAEWPALLGGLTKGDYDILITCMSKQEASKENVNLSDSYYLHEDVIVVNKGDDKIKNKQDLKGKVVGVQTGSGSEQTVDKLKDLKDIKRYNYNPEAFIDLKANRIDAVVVGYPYAVEQSKKDQSFEVVKNSPLSSSEIIMVMRKDENELTKKINEALKNIKENKTYDEIHDKWLKIKE